MLDAATLESKMLDYFWSGTYWVFEIAIVRHQEGFESMAKKFDLMPIDMAPTPKNNAFLFYPNTNHITTSNILGVVGQTCCGALKSPR